MKKVLSLIIILCISSGVYAKKIKFAVNMGTNTISPNGIHVMGDFQIAAGYTANLDPSSISLTQEGSTTIYSAIVNVPAFQKYEYQFVNGDQTYEAEFVPIESSVDAFNNNRWLYVDSLANDTTFVGAIMFGGNAPAGKSLIRFKVDMSANMPVSANGIHVGASYQSFNPATIYMYSFADDVYEVINYVTNGTYEFKFYNGKTTGNAETVPNTCANAGNRSIIVTKDTVMPDICFSSCINCAAGVGVKENSSALINLKMHPNPASNVVTLSSKVNGAYTVVVFDAKGKQVMLVKDIETETTQLNIGNFNSGIYFVRIIGKNNQSAIQKLVVE
ncbi:MAG: T9SS type A sorting domain-containing protein [Bacteroidetes bacterium]|nr:T9SS type A sorting domain-containing protein [Bacteroidota bacterium]